MEKIAAIELSGLRSLESLRIELTPFTVLIGENGGGKSTILEALALLSAAEGNPRWLHERFEGIHGGLPALARWGTPPVLLAAEIVGEGGPRLRYEIKVDEGPRGVRIAEENLTELDSGRALITRTTDGHAEVWNAAAQETQRHTFGGEVHLFLPGFGENVPNEGMRRTKQALRRIAVHSGWNITPAWRARALGWSVPARSGETLVHPERLEPTGDNVASVWHRLYSDLPPDRFLECIDLVRLGLGDDIEGVKTPPDSSGGRVSLRLTMRGGRQVLAAHLSDGQLAWLMWVALLSLAGNEGGLLAIDEPESHLHPGLIVYLVDLLQRHSAERPVLVATHSDVLLDALSLPAGSVRLLALDRSRRTTVATPDAGQLAHWLREYRGLGQIRAEGLVSAVMGDAG